MGYEFGSVVEGIMKIAEVTTDTETGCLAFSSLIITGESIEEDVRTSQQSTEFLVEPMELCFISYRTGKKQTIWKYDPDVKEHARKESKAAAIMSFIERTGADLIDVDSRTDQFKEDMYYYAATEELDYFVDTGKNRDYRRPGKMESAKDILSSNDVVRRILSVKEIEGYVNGTRAQESRGKAHLN